VKKKVLIFPCGSEIGMELYKSLRYSTHFELIGGTSTDGHGRFVFSEYVDDLPYVDDPDFTDKLNRLISARGIDYIFPAHDSAVLTLSREAAAGRLACPVITSPAETCSIARSKRKTYEVLASVVPTAKVFNSVGEVAESDLPVFLKPDVGQSSKGVQLARTIEDISFYLEQNPDLLILEYLPGREYTVDCFTDRHGKLRYSLARERVRVANGISVNSRSVDDDRIDALAAALNDTLDFRGVWFFQVKENRSGDLALLEIAPRVPGTLGLLRCRGVNAPLLSLFDAAGFDISISMNQYEMEIDRALQNTYQHNISYGHVYIDLDDLILFEGTVNPMVMAFVFQCRNKGVKLHLLTRHKDDLHQTLEEHGLDRVFDELIWVKEGHKHTHIVHDDAIFIDDSFEERRAVQEACGIPVFDAHMIEGLMEKY
jgi:anti-anti-sigma regulatory factor